MSATLEFIRTKIDGPVYAFTRSRDLKVVVVAHEEEGIVVLSALEQDADEFIGSTYTEIPAPAPGAPMPARAAREIQSALDGAVGRCRSRRRSSASGSRAASVSAGSGISTRAITLTSRTER